MNSLDMLKTEEGQLNAVFACFGSAAQHSQFFEVALGEFLLAYNGLCHTTLSIADLGALENKLEKQTLGSLLKQLRVHVTIKEDYVNDLMDEALQKRNFLMHHFFRQRREEFRSEMGRREMLAELVSIDTLLEKATDFTNGMRVALKAALDGSTGPGAESAVVFTMEVELSDADEAAQPAVAADDASRRR